MHSPYWYRTVGTYAGDSEVGLGFGMRCHIMKFIRYSFVIWALNINNDSCSSLTLTRALTFLHASVAGQLGVRRHRPRIAGSVNAIGKRSFSM